MKHFKKDHIHYKPNKSLELRKSVKLRLYEWLVQLLTMGMLQGCHG